MYSTCTMAPEENEAVVKYLQKKFPDAILSDISLSIDKKFWQKNTEIFRDQDFSCLEKKCIRVHPSDLTEGFFLAKILKK